MNTYDFGRSLPAPARGTASDRTLVAVLQAFIDESGTHAESENLVLAGYVGTVDQWAKFEPAWNNMLVRNGASLLHATELKSGKGRFQGVPFPQRKRLIQNAEEVANHYLSFRFFISLEKKEYKAIKFRLDAARIYDSMYGLLFRALIGILPLFAERHCAGYEKLDVYLEHGPKSVSAAVKIFEEYKRGSPYMEKYGIVGSGGKDILAFQAADMMAFASLKDVEGDSIDWSESVTVSNLPPINPAVFPTIKMTLNREALEEVISRFESRQKQRKSKLSPHFLLKP